MIRCRHVTCGTQVANWVKTCSRLTVDAKEDLSECCESATADMPKVRVLRVCDCSECCESATADMPKVRVLRVCDC